MDDASLYPPSFGLYDRTILTRVQRDDTAADKRSSQGEDEDKRDSSVEEEVKEKKSLEAEEKTEAKEQSRTVWKPYTLNSLYM